MLLAPFHPAVRLHILGVDAAPFSLAAIKEYQRGQGTLLCFPSRSEYVKVQAILTVWTLSEVLGYVFGIKVRPRRMSLHRGWRHLRGR